MSNKKKRTYRSTTRSLQASQTRKRILTAAKNLFKSIGFEGVTIDQIAQDADVSTPTIYSIFQSKLGVLRALMDEVLPKDTFDTLVEKSIETTSPIERLHYSAKIARKIYDAEKSQMEIFRGAHVLAPEFKELEKEREKRRHNRQEVTIQAMKKEKSLLQSLSTKKARDILWSLTGRDIYRMLVIEQGWTSEQYESWLAQLLVNALVDPRV